MQPIFTSAAAVALVAWLGLATLRGRFWAAPLEDRAEAPERPPLLPPRVHAVIPARDEADVLERTLRSVLAQRYDGELTVTLVDDRSTDGTAVAARRAAEGAPEGRVPAVVSGTDLPPGWTGKLWALSRGIEHARRAHGVPDLWWFTDADIEHDPRTLDRLVARARRDGLDLVSLMVELHCASGWERLLVPAFVFFFQKLYPFAWANDPRRSTAAAAGGCVLLSEAALRRIGGIAAISDRLIDDCALAAAVKDTGGWIRLSLTTRSRSVRPYDGLQGIWSMVARSAYTQLGYSKAALAGTVMGMLVLYVVPVAAVAFGCAAKKRAPLLVGATAWALSAALYAPTVRRYRLPWYHTLTLPAAALLYTAMTLDSARLHRRGTGGGWKGRTY